MANKNITLSFPYLDILALVFILAKSFEYGPIAQWSWFWVFSPFWIPLAIGAAFMLVAITAAFIHELLK